MYKKIVFLIYIIALCILSGCRAHKTMNRDVQERTRRIENMLLNINMQTETKQNILHNTKHDYAYKIVYYSSTDSLGTQYILSEETITGTIKDDTEEKKEVISSGKLSMTETKTDNSEKTEIIKEETKPVYHWKNILIIIALFVAILFMLKFF